MTEDEIKTIVHAINEGQKEELVNIVEDMLRTHDLEQSKKMMECQAYVTKLRTQETTNKEDWRKRKNTIIAIVAAAIIVGSGPALINWLDN